jgi:hypothetical protein
VGRNKNVVEVEVVGREVSGAGGYYWKTRTIANDNMLRGML